MNSEEFREACELAGLHTSDIATGPGWKARHYTNNYVWRWNDPALPSYVADLLVAKVREMEDFGRSFNQAMFDVCDPEGYLVCATPEQRIRAAVAVLRASVGRGADGEVEDA